MKEVLGTAILIAMIIYLSAIGHDNDAITTIATIVIAIFTVVLVVVTRNAIIHGRDVERAYITGGGPVDPQTGTIFSLQISNCGKTVAFLTKYAVTFRSLKDLTDIPDYLIPGYGNIKVFNNRIPPGDQPRPVISMKVPQGLVDPVVYGRFWYRDIWHKEHYFSFILSIHDNATHPDINGPSQAYTEWT